MSGWKSRHHAAMAADGLIPFAEPDVSPHYAPDRKVRIKMIDLQLQVFVDRQAFEGQAVIDFQWLAGHKSSFSLDLLDVEVLSVTCEGKDVRYRHADGSLTLFDVTADQVTVSWRGEKPAAGLYFIDNNEVNPNRGQSVWTQCQDEDAHYFFPCHDHPSSKHAWRITLKSDEKLTHLSNGTKLSETTDANIRTSVWDQPEPMPAYLVTMVAAPLVEVEDSWRGRQVNYFVPPDLGTEHVERCLGKTPEMLEAFSKRLKVDYPWPRYDQVVVHDFVFGGMENVACTTMADVLLADSKSVLEWDPEGLVSHELAHQWFGDLLTCRDWSQGWLNESWATYMEAIWVEESKDPIDANWYRHSTAAGYLGEVKGRYCRPIVSYNFKEPIDVFDRHLYNKGSCVLWTMRYELGEEAFWSGVTEYLNRFAHKTVVTRDFQGTMEDVTGRNLDGFFKQWIHSAGHPILDVKLGRAEGVVELEIAQTQSGDDVPEAFAFQLTVEVVDGDASQVYKLAVKRRNQSFTVPASAEAIVRVDPDYRVLAEIRLGGDSSLLEPLLGDACPILAKRAGQGLLKTGERQAMKSVMNACQTAGFWGVRESLIKALGASKTDEVRDLAIELLKTDADARVRRSAASVLGGFLLDESAAASLKDAIIGSETWQLHAALLTALGKTRVAGHTGLFAEQLTITSWADCVPRAALAGLAASRDPAALPILLKASKSDNERLRGAAAVGLASISEHCPDHKSAIRERLLMMLDEGGVRSRVGTISALAKLADPATLGTLGKVHKTAADGRIRRQAYEAMTRIRKTVADVAAMSELRDRLTKIEADNTRLQQQLDKLKSS